MQQFNSCRKAVGRFYFFLFEFIFERLLSTRPSMMNNALQVRNSKAHIDICTHSMSISHYVNILGGCGSHPLISPCPVYRYFLPELMSRTCQYQRSILKSCLVSASQGHSDLCVLSIIGNQQIKPASCHTLSCFYVNCSSILVRETVYDNKCEKVYETVYEVNILNIDN